MLDVVVAAAPPKLLVELRADQCINQTVAALRFGLLPLVSANAADSLVDLLTGADEMVAVRNWRQVGQVGCTLNPRS